MFHCTRSNVIYANEERSRSVPTVLASPSLPSRSDFLHTNVWTAFGAAVSMTRAWIMEPHGGRPPDNRPYYQAKIATRLFQAQETAGAKASAGGAHHPTDKFAFYNLF